MSNGYYAIIPVKRVTYDQLRAAGATMDTARKSRNGKSLVLKFSHKNHVPFLGLKWLTREQALRAVNGWDKSLIASLLDTIRRLFR